MPGTGILRNMAHGHGSADRRKRALNQVFQQLDLVFAPCGRLLCLLGLHRYRVIDVTLSFGSGRGVAKLECERCHFCTTRCS